MREGKGEFSEGEKMLFQTRIGTYRLLLVEPFWFGPFFLLFSQHLERTTKSSIQTGSMWTYFPFRLGRRLGCAGPTQPGRKLLDGPPGEPAGGHGNGSRILQEGRQGRFQSQLCGGEREAAEVPGQLGGEERKGEIAFLNNWWMGQ